jgi:sporulation protein YlmC with PRC-barrel domain
MRHPDRQRKVLSGAVLAVGVAFSGAALAQEYQRGEARQPQMPPGAEQQMQEPGQQPFALQEPRDPLTLPPGARPGMLGADEMIGRDIEGIDGEHLGTVHEIVMNERGEAQFLIIRRGGFMMVGAELVAVPWELAQPEVVMPTDAWWGERIVIQLDQQTIETAPRLDRGRLDEDIAAVDWHQVVRHWQQYDPGIAAQPPQQPMEPEARSMEPGIAVGEPGLFQAFDLNNDGVITRQELRTAMQIARRLGWQFDQIDQAGDGTITEAEFAQFEEQVMPHLQQPGVGPMAPGHGPRGQ